MSICSTLFANVAYALLLATGWKWKVVRSNRALVCKESVAASKVFYRQMLKRLTRHVGEIVFDFDKFKRLPRQFSDYPHKYKGVAYELAPGSKSVLQKMRDGGIFLTAHYGNYEAIGPWLCCLGIPLKASYVPLKPDWLNRLVEKKMRCVGGECYSVNARTPREFLRLVDSRKLFCLLADQDSRIASAAEGTFLGQRVHVNPIPAFLLRHRPDTPVFMCWLQDSVESGSLHRILHAEQVDADSKNVDALFAVWLESHIKDDPALWYGWTHRRFYSVNSHIYEK